MEKRLSVWDVIAWVILIAIAFWLLLKVLGVITTPALLEYAPIFGAVYLAGWAMHKLETAAEDVRELKSFNKCTVKEITQIKEKCIKNHGN